MYNFDPKLPRLSVNVVLIVRVFVYIVHVDIHEQFTKKAFVYNFHVDLREFFLTLAFADNVLPLLSPFF